MLIYFLLPFCNSNSAQGFSADTLDAALRCETPYLFTLVRRHISGSFLGVVLSGSEIVARARDSKWCRRRLCGQIVRPPSFPFGLNQLVAGMPPHYDSTRPTYSKGQRAIRDAEQLVLDLFHTVRVNAGSF